MKKKCVFLFFLIIHLPGLASKAVLQPLEQHVDSTDNHSPLQYDLNTLILMNARDLFNGSSNLNLINNTGTDLTVYGVYLYGVAFITPGLDCMNGIVGQTNSTTQAFISGPVTPIQFKVGQSVPIGQNYLYNMLYDWMYFYATIGGTPGCLLPGCTWTGETPHNWCFQLGATSPDTSYTYPITGTNVAPFSWAPSRPPFYAYNLIPNPGPDDAYTWLGPFTCDDKTLTCTTSVPQYQSFSS